MSIQLMVVAAYLEGVNKTQKLVLMKIADSADDQTRLARPGLERMMAWAGVGEKSVITVVTELVGLRLVERVTIGRAGRRAEYRVFPDGVPPIPSTEELIERRLAAQSAPKNPRLARKGGGRRKPSAPARTDKDVAAVKDAGQQGFPQGNPRTRRRRVPVGEPDRFPRANPVGSPGETPSLPSSSSPLPNPPTPVDGTQKAPTGGPAEPPHSRCPRHPVQPARSCRGCGTNPRAGREEAERHARSQEHADEQERLRAFVEDQAQRMAQRDSVAVGEARQQARELARKGREMNQRKRRAEGNSNN
ncbi:helix-turn-helix domain-containing protein [Streptomyces sp. NPDC014733]|uniref:helix-turn-helix domain-containing protein n=1 Tax=Streptomyces sp. NPDC014733 TaxID=3364885 RepID=UPI003700232F